MMARRKQKPEPRPRPFAVLPILGYSVECYWADLTDTDRDAAYDHSRRRIRICTSLHNPTDVTERLIHECIHAVDLHLNLELTEHQVKILGTGLTQMLDQYLKAVK